MERRKGNEASITFCKFNNLIGFSNILDCHFSNSCADIWYLEAYFWETGISVGITDLLSCDKYWLDTFSVSVLVHCNGKIIILL